MKKSLSLLLLHSILPLSGMEESKSLSPITPKRESNALILSPTTVEQSYKKRAREEVQEPRSPFIQSRMLREDQYEGSSEGSIEQYRKLQAATLLAGIKFDGAEPSGHIEERNPSTPRPASNEDLHTRLCNAMIVIERDELTLADIQWHTEGLNTLATAIEVLEDLSDDAWEKWYAVLEKLGEKVSLFSSKNPAEASDWILREFKKNRNKTTDTLAGAVQKGMVDQQEKLETLITSISNAW